MLPLKRQVMSGNVQVLCSRKHILTLRKHLLQLLPSHFAQCFPSLSLSLDLKTMTQDTIAIASFHAHVYYDTGTREIAVRVREGLSAKFDVQLGRWRDEPVGPHPKSMYQVAFSPNQFAEVVPWLMLHREGLDVLVHPNTGDAVADHMVHSLWLGEKLDLNVEVLRAA
jgi:aromatic ring-cleaving dioxygenase